MAGFKLKRKINAPVEKVWAAADFTTSVDPYRMDVLTKGDPNNNLIGFTRKMYIGKRTAVERLLEVDPLHSYTYTLDEGIPIKNDYRGVVTFEKVRNKTKLTWKVKFTPKILGSGWLIALKIKGIVGDMIDEIEKKC
ncbi:SRPBCC family protein [Eubacteriaceae bacterium ES3]|nr:SRPBCC family protein [Eubacteriaceae bacterium ES3]